MARDIEGLKSGGLGKLSSDLGVRRIGP